MQATTHSLTAQAAELGVVLEPRQAQTLLEFAELLVRWNHAFNLVSRRDVDRVVPRHLLDSLSVAPWLVGHRVLDLGTGAGLPGVPLAIAREDAHFTLIDLSERRIRFVRRAVRSLALENVTARCADARNLPGDDTFDTVVCRAVSDPDTAWRLAAPRLEARGRMIVMSRAGGAPGGHGGIHRVGTDRDGADRPAGAVLEARRTVHIPGLSRPHEIMLLRHRPAEPARP